MGAFLARFVVAFSPTPIFSTSPYLPRTPVNRLPHEVFALYLDAVDPGEDDFRELSSLLFGAKERYRSVRVTIRHTVDAAVAEEANRRLVDWRFEQPGGSGLGTEIAYEEEFLEGTFRRCPGCSPDR
jgi:hypothetical protein